MNPDLIHNERTRLTATWLNTIGSASIVVGIVTPVAATVDGLSSAARLNWSLLAVATIWLLIGTSINLLARRMLRKLRSMTLVQFLYRIAPALVLLAGAYGIVRYFEAHDRPPYPPGE